MRGPRLTYREAQARIEVITPEGVTGTLLHITRVSRVATVLVAGRRRRIKADQLRAAKDAQTWSVVVTDEKDGGVTYYVGAEWRDGMVLRAWSKQDPRPITAEVRITPGGTQYALLDRQGVVLAFRAELAR